jgi:hypothetical protein
MSNELYNALVKAAFQNAYYMFGIDTSIDDILEELEYLLLCVNDNNL